MRGGTTHPAYQAGYVAGLGSGFVLAAEVHAADQPDTAPLARRLLKAQVNVVPAGSGLEVEPLRGRNPSNPRSG
jgi:hypothetical protein